jgi:hypothetical protein
MRRRKPLHSRAWEPGPEEGMAKNAPVPVGFGGVAIRHCEPPLKTEGSRSLCGGASPTVSLKLFHAAGTHGAYPPEIGGSRVRLCEPRDFSDALSRHCVGRYCPFFFPCPF